MFGCFFNVRKIILNLLEVKVLLFFNIKYFSVFLFYGGLKFNIFYCFIRFSELEVFNIYYYILDSIFFLSFIFFI